MSERSMRNMQNDVSINGLTSQEAKKRFSRYGLNEIPEEKRWNPVRAFFSQFDNFLTLLLIFAALVSFFLGEHVDALFISLIILLNSAFGLYQEYKAEHALSSLKKMTVTTVRVFRSGHEEVIDSRYLVPGDVIHLDEGSRIPADSKILHALHFELNESSLTGESMPVEKTTKHGENEIYLGTIVVKGRCYALVEKTGLNTRFGKIAQTLKTIEKVKTPLQRKLEAFTKQVGIIGIVAAFTVFVLSFIQTKTAFTSFVFAVSLAVAAVPEGLPAVMTITLALGVERMAKRKAIVKKLNAIEALGSVTIVATDKTGTLTANTMRVSKLWFDGAVYDALREPSLRSHAFHMLLLDGILCSTATLSVVVDGAAEPEVIGDTTEGAILHLAQKLGMSPPSVRNDWVVRDELSFNPVTKRMTVVVSKGSESYVFTKGAPESILSICNRIVVGRRAVPLKEAQKSAIEREFQTFAKKGLRMIAFSYKRQAGKNFDEDQVFIGFAGLADPVRPEVMEAVKRAKNAGIRIVMITGDNELTAEAVGIETGIIKKGEEVISGSQIDSLSDSNLSAMLSRVKIFARTTPEHKYRLVNLYQKQGEVVAVTGDGVNDALALKQADVGVAMGITGTDVAKETADIIITDDNFASLINAVEEGRHIFSQIKNSIKYLLSCNLGEIIYILSAVTFGLPVLTPLQILYMNIATDGLPAISIAFSPRDSHIMREKPRKVMTILEKRDFNYMIIVGVAAAILGFLVVSPVAKLFSSSFTDEVTMVFFTIILVQQFILIDLWLSHKPAVRNFSLVIKPIFLLAFFVPICIHPFIIYNPLLSGIFKTTPLSLPQLAFSAGSAGLMFLGMEIARIARHSQKRG